MAPSHSSRQRLYHLKVIRGSQQTLLPESYTEVTIRSFMKVIHPEVDTFQVQAKPIPLGTLQSAIESRRGAQNKHPVLVIELLTDNTVPRDIAYIGAQLHVALTRNPSWPSHILLVVERADLLGDGAFLRQVKEAGAELWASVRRSPEELFHFVDGSFTSQQVQLPGAPIAPESIVDPNLRPQLDPADLDLLFGHFELDEVGSHTNVVPRLTRLAKNPQLGLMVARAAAALFTEERFSICVHGAYPSELSRLALTLAGGDTKRLIPGRASPEELSSSRTLLLTDVWSPERGLQGMITDLQARGWEVKVLALCGLVDAPDLNVPVTVLCTLPPVAWTLPPDRCPYCDEGTNGVGETVGNPSSTVGASPVAPPGHFERGLDAFGSREFWDLLSWRDDFCSFGHWRSTTTNNHFSLRVVTEPLFRELGYAVATRLRSGLLNHGVLPEWIHGIICTDGAESGMLSETLAELLRVPPDAILRVPAEYRRESAGTALGPRLEEWLSDRRNMPARTIAGRNVVILDQAAHHFVTYSGLRRIADHLGCTSLAFLVLISRTADQDQVDAILNDLHFVHLYSWRNPSWTRFNCPCGVVDQP